MQYASECKVFCFVDVLKWKDMDAILIPSMADENDNYRFFFSQLLIINFNLVIA